MGFLSFFLLLVKHEQYLRELSTGDRCIGREVRTTEVEIGGEGVDIGSVCVCKFHVLEYGMICGIEWEFGTSDEEGYGFGAGERVVWSESICSGDDVILESSCEIGCDFVGWEDIVEFRDGRIKRLELKDSCVEEYRLTSGDEIVWMESMIGVPLCYPCICEVLGRSIKGRIFGNITKWLTCSWDES